MAKRQTMFHSKNIDEVLKLLDSDKNKGLSDVQIEKRLSEYGLNVLKETKKISPLKIFVEQFMSPLVWVLFGAIIISSVIGEIADSIIIAVILVVNAILGFIQEYKAERAIEALKKMASLKAKVIRNNKQVSIDTSQIVPGDILVLEAGEKVPADARILESVELKTQEAALTGESNPVKKSTESCSEAAGVADRICMIHSGTIITAGKGLAIVTATGMKTEIGKIAHMIQEAKPEPTPLQKKIKELAKWLGILILIICLIVFMAGILKGGSMLEFLIAAVSLAVAAIPEGLAIVVTIAMALGVQRMIKRNALVRKLPSVETLGCTTVICTDKTGTLTHNQMTVKKIYTDNEIINVLGSGYSSEGGFSKKTMNLNLLLKIGALNNDAVLDELKSEIIGDPTEGALIVSARKAGIKDTELKHKFKRISELPFTSERKMMTTIHVIDKEKFAYVKGAPDMVLSKCSHVKINNKIIRLDAKKRKEILLVNEQFASSALRVLGFAYKSFKKMKNDVEANLVFVGLQGMIDPPRKEAKSSIEKCKQAGIKVVMITGDHRMTAMAIAKEIGLEGKAVTGHDLEHIDLDKEVENISVYARVNPEHKMLIVDALKKKGHIVAMTGDGVNDAPALKRSDIGISMGITGTDVAKEASDMILTDDNFSSIVNAVEEGRGIYDNIRKFVTYLLSSNMGEILTIFIAIMLGLPLPLIAIMILWVNLATDGLPALALGVDPIEEGIMSHPPRNPTEKIISNYNLVYMFTIGLIMMLGTLMMFKYYSGGYEENIIYARTVAFTTLVMFQMTNVLNCRSNEASIFKVGVFKNKKLIGAILISILLQLLVLYSPLSVYFKTTPLNLFDWMYIFLVSLSVIIFAEIAKLMRSLSLKYSKSNNEK